MVELFALSGLINGLISIGFGVLVVFKNFRSLRNIIFFLLTVALAVWGISYWLWLKSEDPGDALFWVRMFSIGSTLIPVFFFHWVALFLRHTHYILMRIFLVLIYGGAVFFLTFSFSQLFIQGVEPRMFFPYWPITGPLYSLYLLLFYVGLVGVAIALLMRRYQRVSDPNRLGQILYILLGSIGGFGGGLTNFPLWYNIPFPPYGTFLVALVPLLLGYSMIKHRLFNLKSIAAEVLVFFTLIILLIQTFLSDSLLELILRGVFLGIVGVFGWFLIRSVYNEVETRERIEKLADKLAEANKHLKALDKRKSEFISLASHQLRTPLTVIKGYSSMILEGSFGKFPQKMKQPLERIFKSSDRLVKVIEDYLTTSRIEQDRIEYNFEPADLADIVWTISEEARLDAEEKGLSLEVFIEKKGEYTVAADREKLVQVLGNVVDNAIKYTNEGTITITLSKIPEEQMFRVAVADTGIGMTKKSQEKLFQKFTRGKGGTETDSSGSGLGLYIAKRIVEAHDGSIRAESEGKGAGSTFTIELPMRE